MLLLLLSLFTAQAANPKASSELTNDNTRFSVNFAFDGLLTTAWGAEGDTDEWVTLDLGKSTDIQGVSIWPGNLTTGARSFREHSRPRTLQLMVDNNPVGDPVSVQDEMQRVDLRAGVQGRRITVQVLDTYEGIVFNDLYISEIAVNYPSNEQEARLDKWRESRDALRRAEEFLTQVSDAYTTIKEAEFGDKESFDFLTRAAGEGPEYLHGKAQQLVPAGFRAQAIRASDKAQEAIRKLKDPNGIPALELASLRATGEDKEQLMEVVEIFYAYADLLGGGSRNVQYWGQPGWEKGAFQSFGEPLPLDIDLDGNIYVADTGNNRVQKFSPDGRPMRQWGSDPDITNVWFERGRKWYVSGSRPGDAPGEWNNPVDVEIITLKDTELLAALDATGKIQIFDNTGAPVISWTVESSNAPEPKLGGQSYLTYLPKVDRLYAIIQDEAVGYTLDSEEVARWDITDGTPNAVESTKKGQMLFAFGNEIVRYDLDGFRHGTVIDDKILGVGFEDLDIARDEAGKIWVLTDTGTVFKFKKPGKVDFQLDVTDRVLIHPRIAVSQGILFFLSSDRIEQLDVLQTKLDQAEAKKRAEEAE